MKEPLATNGGRLNLFGVPPVLVDGENYHGLREPNPHEAFGNGPHHCAGAHLSRRTVGVIPLPMPSERFPNMTLPDPANTSLLGQLFRIVVSVHNQSQSDRSLRRHMRIDRSDLPHESAAHLLSLRRPTADLSCWAGQIRRHRMSGVPSFVDSLSADQKY